MSSNASSTVGQRATGSTVMNGGKDGLMQGWIAVAGFGLRQGFAHGAARTFERADTWGGGTRSVLLFLKYEKAGP